MNDLRNNAGNLVDTTDCLEAIDVFKGWKNFLFLIVILSLVVLQGAFWLVNTGFVKTCEEASAAPVVTEAVEEVEQEISPAVVEEVEQSVVAAAAEEVETVLPEDAIEAAAKELVAEANIAPESVKVVETTEAEEPAEAVDVVESEKPAETARAPFKLDAIYLNWIIRFCNFAVIIAATLYCLTMIFSLKISLQGRLGGIKHISKAFFLSLTALVLLLPWQLVFDGILAGVMYTPQQLLDANVTAAEGTILAKIFLYLRFTGYWLLLVFILIVSQLRSRRWTKAILKRLEVI